MPDRRANPGEDMLSVLVFAEIDDALSVRGLGTGTVTLTSGAPAGGGAHAGHDHAGHDHAGHDHAGHAH